MTIKVIWNVDTNEAAQILNALAERPFKEVNNLIGKLHASTSEQIKAHEDERANGDSNKRE